MDGAVCDLINPDGANVRFVEEMASGESGSMTASTAFTLPAAGSVRLQCIGNVNPGNMRRQQSSLSATQVESLVIP